MSKLAGKEIINISDGMRLSVIEECEFAFDEKNGKINSLLLPPQSSLIRFFNTNKPIVIHWRDIRKIGDEIVIVDIK